MVGKLSQPRWLTLNTSGQLQWLSPNQGFTDNVIRFFNGDVMQQMTAVAGGNVTGTNQASQVRVFIEHAQVEMQFANASNVVANLQVYDYYMRKTSLQGVETGAQGPLAFANAEMQVEQNTTGTNPLTVWGTSPGESVLMRRMWQRKGMTKVVLGPGETHTHKVFVAIRKTLRAADLSQYVGSGPNIPGWTRYVAVIGSGTPVDDSTSGTGHPTVSASDGRINFIGKVTYRYRFMASDTSSATYTNYLATIGSGNETFVNEKSGNIATYSAS